MSTSESLKLIAILGPTSSGKSALAIEIATQWNGEIVSIDSRQVYRGMDIGTGKVTKAEQQEVRHHLLDIADPNDDYNISHFLRDARAAIESIKKKGKIQILCGGTGFWMEALVENHTLPNIPPDPVLREILSQKTTEKLFEMLTDLDPKRADEIDKKNPRRLIRAIEIARSQRVLGSEYSVLSVENETSKKSNQIPDTHSSPLLLALCPPKELIDTKIKARLDARFNEGMIDEVARLHNEGVSWKRLDTFGLEYRWISRYLQNLISEAEMKEKLFFDISHYAKRQMTWIRRWRRSNHTLRIVERSEEALKIIEKFLEKENCSESLPNS